MDFCAVTDCHNTGDLAPMGPILLEIVTSYGNRLEIWVRVCPVHGAELATNEPPAVAPV